MKNHYIVSPGAFLSVAHVHEHHKNVTYCKNYIPGFCTFCTFCTTWILYISALKCWPSFTTSLHSSPPFDHFLLSSAYLLPNNGSPLPNKSDIGQQPTKYPKHKSIHFALELLVRQGWTTWRCSKCLQNLRVSVPAKQIVNFYNSTKIWMSSVENYLQKQYL